VEQSQRSRKIDTKGDEEDHMARGARRERDRRRFRGSALRRQDAAHPDAMATHCELNKHS
jgi:hypothetical protein